MYICFEVLEAQAGLREGKLVKMNWGLVDSFVANQLYEHLPCMLVVYEPQFLKNMRNRRLPYGWEWPCVLVGVPGKALSQIKSQREGFCILCPVRSPSWLKLRCITLQSHHTPEGQPPLAPL